jgi:hypothetical protein
VHGECVKCIYVWLKKLPAKLAKIVIFFLMHDIVVTEIVRLNRLRWFVHVQRMEENRIPQKSIICECGSNKAWEVDQEIDGKMKWGMMADQLVEKGGRKGYITERYGRSSWEQ